MLKYRLKNILIGEMVSTISLSIKFSNGFFKVDVSLRVRQEALISNKFSPHVHKTRVQFHRAAYLISRNDYFDNDFQLLAKLSRIPVMVHVS